MKQLILAVLLIFTSFCYSQECDLLILKDGSEISVLVTELRLTEIAYKKCDNLNGPMYVVRNQEVFMIKFKNGTSQVIKSEETSENKQVVSVKEKLEKDKIYFEPKRFYVEPEIGYGRCLLNDVTSSTGYFYGWSRLKSTINLNAKFGYVINKKIGMGILLGYNRLKQGSNNYIFRNMTTFAGYLKLCYGGKRIIPYSDFELGTLINLNKKNSSSIYGAINYERAIYFKPSFGLSYAFSNKMNLQASLSYTFMGYYVKGVVSSNNVNYPYNNYSFGQNNHVLSLNFSLRYMI